MLACVTFSHIIFYFIKKKRAAGFFNNWSRIRPLVSMSTIHHHRVSTVSFLDYCEISLTDFLFAIFDSQSLFSVWLPKCLSNYVTSCDHSVQYPPITSPLIQSEIQNHHDAMKYTLIHYLYLSNLTSCYSLTQLLLFPEPVILLYLRTIHLMFV